MTLLLSRPGIIKLSPDSRLLPAAHLFNTLRIFCFVLTFRHESLGLMFRNGVLMRVY